MFLKILLTLLVIIGAALTLRLRKRPAQPTIANDMERQAPTGESSIPKVAAYGALAIMLFGCAMFIYYQWQDTWKVVTVRVINSGNGKESIYQAYKSDVRERSFTTTDGRTVNLAEVERMELGGY